jgi:predicted dithiol-disulfide oxidoreductase (DUF899 family)
MKIVSLYEATNQKLTRYFTGKSCKFEHIAERLVSNRTCIVCLNIKKQIRGQIPKIKEKDLARLYAADTPAKHLARTKKRQAAKIKRLPKWLTANDIEHMQALYSLAAMFQRESGVMYHVDHIIPLQGKLVSGLHVPNNLRVIPATDNLKKSNKHVM